MDEKTMNMAKVIVDDALAIKEGEKVLVVTDDGIGNYKGMSELLEAIVKVLNDKAFDPCVISYKARMEDGGEIPAVAEAACMASDVIITLNTNTFLHAGAFPRIYQGGTTNRRILLLPAGVNVGDTDFLVRMMPQTKEELKEIADITEKFGAMFNDGNKHTIHLTNKNGTDLTLDIGTLSGATQSGNGVKPGAGQLLPSGSLAIGVTEGSANGVLVADNCNSMEDRFLEVPMTFRIADGYIQSFDDGVETQKFIAAADAHPEGPEQKYCVAEIGLGFNPKAELNGCSPEGELVYGTVHVGIGSNITFGGNVFVPAWHIDFIEPAATVELDGKLVLKDGEYVV